MEKEKAVRQKRMVVYISGSKYNLLRSKLILIGKTVSSWFRNLVDEYLSK